MNRNRLNTLLIKPTSYTCNLNCAYCFYLEKEEFYKNDFEKLKMKEETLEIMTRQILGICDQPIFAWQGGEPTLMGLDFYKKAVELQKKYAQGKTVQNAFQTNGLLLNEEWADFFKENQFLIGISIDGTQPIHDHYRVDKQGSGTWDRVIDNAMMLVEKDVEVNALATINKISVKHPQETYHFFKKLGLGWMQFIPIVETDKKDPSKSADFSVKAEDYGEFLCRVFDEWVKDINFKELRQTTSVRTFDSILALYVGQASAHCIFSEICAPYLVVEHNGDIYSCDYYVYPEYLLGNIHQHKLEQLYNSDKHIEFGLQKKNLDKKCLKCQWLKYCHGGCCKDRIKDPRDQGHNHFCKAYLKFYHYANKTFKKIADLYKTYY